MREYRLLIRRSSYFNKMGGSAINARMGAQILVQSCAFEASKAAIESTDSQEKGYVTAQDISFGGSGNTAPQGNMTTVPYHYSLLGSAEVKNAVVGVAGQTLLF